MLSADQLKAAVDAARKCKPTGKAHSKKVLANLVGPAPAASATRRTRRRSVPQEENLTRAEVADYLDRTGWDPKLARKLAAIERAVDFGDGLSSKQLDAITNLLLSTLDADRATLHLDVVDLVARWLLRKRRAVGPDGGTIVWVRTLEEAKKIVAGWIKDKIAHWKDITSRETEAAVLKDLAGVTHAGLAERKLREANAEPARRKPSIRRKTNPWREARFFAAIQASLEGMEYCRFIDSMGVRPLEAWISEGCPGTYAGAYRVGEPWRKKIQDQKNKAKCRFGGTAPAEREHLIQSVTRSNRSKRVNLPPSYPA